MPKPANIRIVQSFERYIEAYGPRVYGYWPGQLAVVGPVDRLDRDARHRLEVGVAQRRRLVLLPPPVPCRHNPIIGHREPDSRGGYANLHRPARDLLEQTRALPRGVALELEVALAGRHRLHDQPIRPHLHAHRPHAALVAAVEPDGDPQDGRRSVRTTSWSRVSRAANSGWVGLGALLRW